MAKKSMKIRTARGQLRAAKERASGKKVHRPTKVYNRCKLCGRVGGYIRRFEICRICFRELAREGKIMGVTKSSW